MGDRGGTCKQCDPASSSGGWSPFTGPALLQECAAGQVCAAGACTGGCFIDGTFVGTGAIDGLSACLSCQPLADTARWSALATGEACGDGGHCNGQSCEQGCQIGDALFPVGAPDPGDSCRSCQPAIAWSSWSPISGVPPFSCGGGAVCDRGTCKPGCWIDGGYLPSGFLEPGHPCRVCESQLSSSDFTGLSGDVLGACGPGAVCELGACLAGCYLDAGGYQAPGAFQPGNSALCCGPSHSTTDWSPTFLTGQVYAPLAPNLVAGDLDGDGFTDLVVGDDSAGFQVFLGDGDGGLSNPFLPPIPLGDYGGHTTIALGDLDGDGTQEIVAWVSVDGGGALGVCTRATNGGFALAATYPVSSPIVSLALGDFDGDGHLDVAAFVNNSGVQIFLNLGDGGLVLGPNLGLGFGGSLLAAADFNGDGTTDLALPSYSFGSYFWFGDGGGGFPTSTLAPQSYDAPVPVCLKALDLQGNGRAELVIGASDSVNLQIISVGTDNSAQLTTYPIGVLSSLALADLNGDGLPDVIASDRRQGNLELMINSSGGFLPSAAIPVEGSDNVDQIYSVVVGRFEPDAGLGLAVLTSIFSRPGGLELTLYGSGCR